MRSTLFTTLFAATLAAFALADTADHTNAPGFKNVIKPNYPLRVLLSNDDSWASANIRATYYALKTAGHKVLMVAPVVNQSGKGGTVVLPGTQTLTTDGRDGSVKAGAPYHGAEPYDAGLTYVNATPAGAVLYGFDQVVPQFFNNQQPQIVVSGPNEGNNLGPFLFTLSGTIGGAYSGVERSVPAIAFSAATTPRDFNKVDWNNPSDEAVILGTNSANLVAALTYVTKQGKALLPLGVGANVNYGTKLNDSTACPRTKWQHTRLTGGAYVDKIVIGANGLPTYQNIVTEGLNRCINGDCKLPGEQNVINSDPCAGTVSIFSVDYDAPNSAFSQSRPSVNSAIQRLNSNHPTTPGHPKRGLRLPSE